MLDKEPRHAGLFFALLRHVSKRAFWYLTGGLLILVWQAYAPGLDGPFLYDDHANITSNDAVKVKVITPATLASAMESGRTGPLRRPISMASFAIDHARAGLNPGAFKRTNLLIHLFCGLMAAGLSFLLSTRVFWREASHAEHLGLALLVACLWMIHPLQLTNVLYVVQRMNSLCGLFTIAALICYCATRFHPDGRIVRPGAAGIIGTVALTLAAMLSKENGVLTFGYLATIEIAARYTLEPYRRSADRTLMAMIGLGGVTTIALLAAFHKPLLEAYANRPFTLGERLLTEPRVLLWYLKLMVMPDIHQMGLIHDDWTVSPSLVAPASTLAAIAVWLLAIALAWRTRFSMPLILFGLLWYLVGHSVESTFMPLLLVFEHRNYLPLFGICFAVLALLARKTRRLPKILKALPALAIVVALYGQTRERAHAWSDDAVWIQAEARNHPNSSAAQYLKGDLFAQFATYVPADQRHQVIATADSAFQRAWELNPTDISPLLARAYHWPKLGRPANEKDLRAVSVRLSEGPVPVPAQNAVLTYCKQVRDGAAPYLGPLHDEIFAALLNNRSRTVYIAERLKPCADAVAARPTQPADPEHPQSNAAP
jgi:protein O-mannosyl-transferase